MIGRLLCKLNLHKWRALEYQWVENRAGYGEQFDSTGRMALIKDFCERCGKVSNMIMFEGKIHRRS